MQVIYVRFLIILFLSHLSFLLNSIMNDLILFCLSIFAYNFLKLFSVLFRFLSFYFVQFLICIILLCVIFIALFCRLLNLLVGPKVGG